MLKSLKSRKKKEKKSFGRRSWGRSSGISKSMLSSWVKPWGMNGPARVKFLDVIVMNQLTSVDQQKFIWVDYGIFFYASLSWHKLGYLGIVIHSPFTIIPSWQELYQQRQGVTEQTGDLNIRNEGLNGGAILAIPCFFWEFNMAWCWKIPHMFMFI